jgi:hypothetical protein
MINQERSLSGALECTRRHNRFLLARTPASASLRIAAQYSLVMGDS